MDADTFLPLLMRWIHIFAAIIAVGGTIFVRFVLIPAAETALSDEEHQRLRAAVIRRWKFFLHTCILLFLVSGFYNYIMVTNPVRAGQPLYHMLFGIKFLLALAVFALAILLTSSRAIGQKLREQSRLYLLLLIALATGVVMISGVMKNMPVKPAEAAPPANPVQTQ